MLLSTTRFILRYGQRRGFATATTVSTNSGVKVASVDFGSPASGVTLLVKAGGRFQNKEGIANVLKNFAFKSTTNRSAIGTVREAELYGGLLSASLGREHLAITAEFLRGDEAFFMDVLSTFITSSRFTRHEYEEYVKALVSSESILASQDPEIRALEAAHALAFRSGLGSSIFAPAHSTFEVEEIRQYASATFAKGSIAVIGTNINSESLSKLVDTGLGSVAEGSGVTSPASKYFGGETRLEGNGHGAQTVFIGFGTAGTAGATSAEIATLAAYLSSTPSVKWAKGLSPVAKGIPEGSKVQTVYSPYSDASLFGLLVQAETVEGARDASKVAADSLRNAAKALGGKELEGAIRRAKLAAASAVESREGLVDAIGSKIFTGAEVSVESTLNAFDKVTPASFSQAVSSLISAKPTFVAVGDTLKLPHTDELGF